MATIDLGRAYQLNETAFWPSLQPRQVIPVTLRSQRATSGRPSRVGMGMVLAVCSILNPSRIRRFAFDDVANRWSLQTESFSQPGTYYDVGGDTTRWWTDHFSYVTAIVALVDGLTVSRSDPVSQEFIQRWAAFLQVLEQELGTQPPYSEVQVRRAAKSVDCTRGMMAVIDALYFFAQARGATSLTTCAEQPDPLKLAGRPGDLERWLYLQPATRVPALGFPASVAPSPASPPRAPSEESRVTAESASPRPAPVDTGTIATLRRLIRRGGTALLFGPTGVGKSFTARQAALAEQVALVLVEGRPGLEDRDLYGKVYPVAGAQGQAYALVDGFLTEAWRAAAGGQRVVLIIDELARFDPYNLAPLIGSLDKVRGSELRLLVGLSDAVRAGLDPAGEYRVLKMPNGERLIAPVRQLTIIATTNLGSDYVQIQQVFDAALLRRFEVQLEVPRLDAPMRLRILTRDQGLSEIVAQVLVDVEEYTIHNTAAHNGLLCRELNLGTCVNWAVETCELVAAGMPWSEAVQAAAEVTAIPFCCPRGDEGYLDRPAAQSLKDEIRRRVLGACV